MYKYLELKNKIIAGIGDGIWPVGSVIPKEIDLVGQFNVSQSTVSHAMGVLVAEGYIKRKKKAGTVVVSDQPTANKSPANAEIYVVEMVPALNVHTLSWFVSTEIVRGILNNSRFPVKIIRASELMADTVSNCAAKRQNAASALEGTADGTKLLPEQSSIRRGFILYNPDQKLLDRVKDEPYVCMNFLSSKFLPFNSVNNDSAQVAYQSINYLARELGHQKIAIVWGGLLYHQDFLYGCRRAFSAFGLPLNESLIIDTQSGGEEAGYAAGQKLLKRRKTITAVCVDTDYKALGVIRALREAGCRVPADISVIGADEIPEISEKNGLTTASRAFYETGAQAVKMLEKRLDNPAFKPVSLTIGGHIIERRTCDEPIKPVATGVRQKSW